MFISHILISKIMLNMGREFKLLLTKKTIETSQNIHNTAIHNIKHATNDELSQMVTMLTLPTVASYKISKYVGALCFVGELLRYAYTGWVEDIVLPKKNERPLRNLPEENYKTKMHNFFLSKILVIDHAIFNITDKVTQEVKSQVIDATNTIKSSIKSFQDGDYRQDRKEKFGKRFASILTIFGVDGEKIEQNTIALNMGIAATALSTLSLFIMPSAVFDCITKLSSKFGIAIGEEIIQPVIRFVRYNAKTTKRSYDDYVREAPKYLDNFDEIEHGSLTVTEGFSQTKTDADKRINSIIKKILETHNPNLAKKHNSRDR